MTARRSSFDIVRGGPSIAPETVVDQTGLRLSKECESALENLRRELIKGECCGLGAEIEVDRLFDDIEARLDAEAASNAQRSDSRG